MKADCQPFAKLELQLEEQRLVINTSIEKWIFMHILKKAFSLIYLQILLSI